MFNFWMTLLPLGFALFYPNVGQMLAYTGSITGLCIVYIMPIIVHLKKLKTEMDHPRLAEAVDNNEFLMHIPARNKIDDDQLSIQIGINKPDNLDRSFDNSFMSESFSIEDED